MAEASPGRRRSIPTKTSLAFGLRIREARQSQGLTLEQLGERLGLDKGSVSRIESGEAKIGDAAIRVCKLAEALGVPLADLFQVSASNPRRRRNGSSLASG